MLMYWSIESGCDHRAMTPVLTRLQSTQAQDARQLNFSFYLAILQTNIPIWCSENLSRDCIRRGGSIVDYQSRITNTNTCISQNRKKLALFECSVTDLESSILCDIKATDTLKRYSRQREWYGSFKATPNCKRSNSESEGLWEPIHDDMRTCICAEWRQQALKKHCFQAGKRCSNEDTSIQRLLQFQ